VPQREGPIGLRFEKVEKRYGPVQALRSLSLEVPAGECVAVAGRNGSGKTTLLRVAAQLVRPSRGTITYSGLAENRKPAVGFVAHATMLYDELTARENLAFFARLAGVPEAAARVSELLREVDLVDRQDSLVRTFSRGMRQRVAIARALLGRPSLLLFDEPGTGLDAEAGVWLAERLARLRDEGCTILMSLHGESELARLASRAVRLEAGSLVSDTRRGATFQSVFAITGA
jgi:ABC-type multidrug transport system ATPase subunit